MDKILKAYCRAWKMWNTWLLATERPEVEFQDFVESDFAYQTNKYGVGEICGTDSGYDVEFHDEAIYISFKGKPRYSWFPSLVQMGNLNLDEEELDPRCRFNLGSRLELSQPDPGFSTT